MTKAVEILYNMETELIINIIALLDRGSLSSANWQAEKLAQLGTLNSVNAKTIKQSLEQAIKEANIELQLRAMAGIGDIDRTAQKLSVALPEGADDRLKSVLESWEKTTAEKLNNIGAKLLSAGTDKYIETVELATAQALAGQSTLRESIKKTATQWSKQGLPALIDKAGREWSTEAYAQTVIRSNVRNVVTETQNQRMDEYGFDLVEISSHAGARPNCEPYQGKVYSRSGKHSNYPALSETSNGEIDGLFGINCGHTMTIYIEGTKKTATEYPKRENDKVYEESQKQRHLERQIRQSKRELLAVEKLGTPEEIAQAKNKVSSKQKSMRDYLNKTDRTRRYDREQIYN